MQQIAVSYLVCTQKPRSNLFRSLHFSLTNITSYNLLSVRLSLGVENKWQYILPPQNVGIPARILFRYWPPKRPPYKSKNLLKHATPPHRNSSKGYLFVVRVSNITTLLKFRLNVIFQSWFITTSLFFPPFGKACVKTALLEWLQPQCRNYFRICFDFPVLRFVIGEKILAPLSKPIRAE